MDHFIKIYTQQASAYHRMVSPEDIEGNLLPALKNVSTLEGKRVLDLGTGTGRLPLLFGAQTAQMIGLDLHWDMLRVHNKQRQQQNGPWGLVQGDMRRLPFPSGWAEVITAGWSIGHFTGWYPDDWQSQIAVVLNEMHRLVTAGGALIIMETLSTGSTTPAPPSEVLAQYYAWLENEWGFTRQEIGTDFQFNSVDEAAAHMDFFFPDLATKIKEQGWARVPEWTGVWGKQL